MSWLDRYKSKPSTSTFSAESDARDAKRKKLEADRQARNLRREQIRQRIQSAQTSRQEANQALQDLLNIEPDIFENEGEFDEDVRI